MKKLKLEKIRVSKLSTLASIKGGNVNTESVPPLTDTINITVIPTEPTKSTDLLP